MDTIRKQICKTLTESKEVVVVSHVRPDGDAIGSTLALGLALANMGKRVHMWNEDGVPARYEFLRGAERVKLVPDELPEGIDTFICVDVGQLKRIGERAKKLFLQAPYTINIDHHETNEKYASANLVEGDEAACAAVLMKVLRELGAELTPEIADALYVGINTDTGSFMYSSTSAEVMEMAAELIRAGVNVGEINRLVYEELPMTSYVMQREVLEHMRVDAEGAISYYSMPAGRKQELGVTLEDTKDLVDYVRKLRGVKLAAIFEDMENGLIRISLRSKDKRINVAQLAKQFGGGGHEMAAGIRMSGSLEECEEKVLQAMRTAVRELS